MVKTAVQLKALKVGKSLALDSATYDQKQALYKLAYRLNIKISIRQTPSGTMLWRMT